MRYQRWYPLCIPFYASGTKTRNRSHSQHRGLLREMHLFDCPQLTLETTVYSGGGGGKGAYSAGPCRRSEGLRFFGRLHCFFNGDNRKQCLWVSMENTWCTQLCKERFPRSPRQIYTEVKDQLRETYAMPTCTSQTLMGIIGSKSKGTSHFVREIIKR